jgi:SAM-dependent methyltransferase
MGWTDDYFKQDYFEEFANGHISNERTKTEAAFIVRSLGLQAPSILLDLCCGYGRHAIELAALGHQVVAIDNCHALLVHAAEFAKRRDVSIEFVEADMRLLPFKDTFDAVINLFTSFGFFDDEEQDECVLRCVCKALKPQGHFVMDLDNASYVLQEFREQDWRRLPNNGVVVSSRRYDVLRGRVEGMRIHCDPDSKPREYSFSIRLYTFPELEHLLKSAGLIVVATYGGYDGEPFSSSSKRMIVVSRRSE